MGVLSRTQRRMEKMKLVWIVLVLAVFPFAKSDDLIEPSIKMVDRSPQIGRNRMPAGGVNPRQQRGAQPAQRAPLPAHQQGAGFAFDAPTEEAISFGVNTRGEFGNSRAPLFCNCQVLAVLTEDELPQRNEFGEVIGKRSYTAPELRARVPLVTPEYAKTNEQVSFGVNVRGEDGPEFNPTWCTCQILQQQSQNEDQDADAVAEDGDDGEGAPLARRGGPSGGQNTPSNLRSPHALARPVPITEDLQIEEGSTESAAVNGVLAAASKVAENTMNLQEAEAVVTSQRSQEQPTTTTASESLTTVTEHGELAVAAAVPKDQQALEPTSLVSVETIATQAGALHRHSWRTGIDVMHNGTESAVAPSAPALRRGVESSKVRGANIAGDVEFLFHGHKFASNGRQLDVVPQAPKSIIDEVATQILTQLEEGRNVPPSSYIPDDSTTQGVNSSRPVALTPNNATATVTIITTIATNTSNTTSSNNNISNDTMADSRVVPMAEIVPEAANATTVNTTTTTTSTTNTTSTHASENEDDDSEQEDAVQALQRIARSHPHASSVLSHALEMAAMQQRAQVSKLQSELAMKDRLLHTLAIEKTHAEEVAKTELEIVTKMQAMMLQTASSSPSASNSASPSVSASISSSPSASPSPSHSVVHHRHHHHPRVNKNACYHTCRETECAQMFEQSLRQYASCTDQCAAKCYGA